MFFDIWKKYLHDGRKTEKFSRCDSSPPPPPPRKGCQLFKDVPHKLPFVGKWPPSKTAPPPPPPSRSAEPILAPREVTVLLGVIFGSELFTHGSYVLALLKIYGKTFSESRELLVSSTTEHLLLKPNTATRCTPLSASELSPSLTLQDNTICGTPREAP